MWPFNKPRKVEEYVEEQVEVAEPKTLNSLEEVWLCRTGGPEFMSGEFGSTHFSTTIPIEVSLSALMDWQVAEAGREHIYIHEFEHRGYKFFMQEHSPVCETRQGHLQAFHAVKLSKSLVRCERYELAIPEELWSNPEDKQRRLVDDFAKYRRDALIDGTTPDETEGAPAREGNSSGDSSESEIDELSLMKFNVSIGPGIGDYVYVKLLTFSESETTNEVHDQADGIRFPNGIGEFRVQFVGTVDRGLFDSEERFEKEIVEKTKSALSSIRSIDHVGDVRTCGQLISSTLRNWTKRPLWYQVDHKGTILHEEDI